jgi:mutator protein MutT
MEAGRDYVGVGVGAMVFDGESRVFLARRGSAARNEVGGWEFPGGSVEFGERMEQAVRREFREEYGMDIEVRELLGVFDHILAEEGQHWVSATYLAAHVGGVPVIRETGKCTEIGWFRLGRLPGPRTRITERNLTEYRRRYPDR